MISAPLINMFHPIRSDKRNETIVEIQRSSVATSAFFFRKCEMRMIIDDVAELRHRDAFTIF
jgi:hypothetical protein